ncbi:dinucleotide-utilizing enzyme possibly involved in molybdopterin or thiamin biosynthesis [Saprospira grandis DSM 2844]|uniref:Molybdopterin-synthase adenylyltransferase n=1 Tax=Saprospira grandis DSM 2844 TaxID=694433 RepID=J0XW61_9BACT|nr:molybdopterin-synthase adenylyltransferase MoeB [Saprospira grandis]EJF53251.1 dinucleotide-utilizing enzyme possibly involved in molybdopterin or thiamin biosynthesis [Saprospira grandis DSM 2844]
MANIEFSKAELERYSRHIIIPEFNIAGQRKLKAAKVLVVGSGGLGSPLLLYLAAAGVGHIGIVDYDRVDDSNLQRQVLFGTESIGQLKAEAAKARIEALNPHIEVSVYNEFLNSENALDIVKGYDVVADGTDNFPTRYLVNDACVILGKTNVYASIYRFEGQVSVFNYKDEAGNLGPHYRDLFPSPPPPGLVPSCSEGGVLGVLPGIIGSLQALEVIKVITGVGEPLVGRLYLFDALTFSHRTLKIWKNPNTPEITELIDYEQFCGVEEAKEEQPVAAVPSISVQELKQWQEESRVFVLIDVRESYEQEIVDIGGQLIPKGEIEQQLDQIPKTGDVVLHCRSGKRSADVIELLQAQYGYTNLLNLEGGILAYAKEVDQELATY